MIRMKVFLYDGLSTLEKLESWSKGIAVKDLISVQERSNGSIVVFYWHWNY